ncbi:hypothetical protein BWI15_37650 [Kribbella sp. ALI-6-A]|uniref:DUF1501 domain-containing protein n=1 Tax=Kribbella sp. ALI-6-A TaxID=1933817 RepID=UPI00097CB11A|nr:DUF1501 domain-containing protein [Kribbella sp. ALI-6-A]ONI68704.1 hypothetical protein BWI15_37650 [Kribbella sp. ALI-6-A]
MKHSETLSSLHPDCPDWQRLGPTPADAAVRAQAAAVSTEVDQRREKWSRGFTRRRLLAGGLGVGVAAVADQLVTTRISWAAEGADPTGTLVVIFLRGGMDGLSVLVPADDPDLLKARPGIAVRGASLLPFQRGFGLHPALAPLTPLITSGRLAAVPAVSTPDLTRSHFQAQDCLERGGAARSSVQSGWLDRVIAELGPGTTFRGLGIGARMTRSLLGPTNPVMLTSLKDFAVKGIDGVAPQTLKALETLYTGIDHPLGVQGLAALQASAKAQGYQQAIQTQPKDRGYPEGDFGASLATLAQLIKNKAGVRVAAVDLGGWDMHTDIGTVDNGDLTRSLKTVAEGLAAFTAELGPELENTTVVTMSEFGRRVEQNGNSGADHGHGGVALVLGGRVKGGVHGRWEGLDPKVLDQGDVPGTNDYRDVLSDVVMGRLGLSEAQAGKVFPGWKPRRLGVMT